MLPDRTSFERWRRVAWSASLAILVIGGLVAAGESWSERRARIEQMSPAEKDQLLRQQQRFLQLDPAEQQRLRSFAAALDQAPDAAELRQVLDQYYEWLLTLPGLERAQLLQMEPGERLQRIKQIKADQVRLAAHRLSAGDVQAVSDWLERRVMDNVPKGMRDRWQQLTPPERHREIVRMIWQRSQSPDGFRGPGPLKPGDLQDLRAKLSDGARQQLNQALEGRQVGQLMTDWVKQALGRYFSGGRPLAGGGVSEERLRQFFEHELPEPKRQQLLTLPAEELHNQLRRLYYLHLQGGPPGGLPGGMLPGADGNQRRPQQRPPDFTPRRPSQPNRESK